MTSTDVTLYILSESVRYVRHWERIEEPSLVHGGGQWGQSRRLAQCDGIAANGNSVIGGAELVHDFDDVGGTLSALMTIEPISISMVSFGGQLLEVVLVSRSRFQSSGDVSFGADV